MDNNTKIVTLYEDNGGQLTMVCGDRAFTGFQHCDEHEDILVDAKALACGDTSDWTIEECYSGGEYGTPVATITIADDYTRIEFSAGLAGLAALRYVGGSADGKPPDLVTSEKVTLDRAHESHLPAIRALLDEAAAHDADWNGVEFLIELGDWTCIDTTNEIAGAVLLTSIKRLIDEDEGPDGTETSQP
jgi:hypothetical protein